MIKVVINGEKRITNSNLTLKGLLNELELVQERVAVEVNMKVIPRQNYDSIKIDNGDKIEIIQLVGGG